MTADPSRTHVAASLSPINAAFFTYWERLATIERPPRKSAINPPDIRKLLQNLVIYERKDSAVFHIRLMGTAIVQRVGIDLTSRNLLEFFHYAAKDQAQSDLNRIVDEPCGQFLMVKDWFTSGREAWVEIVRLPLTDEAGDTRFTISCTEQKKTTGFAAYTRDNPELIAEPIRGFFFDLKGNVLADTIWTNHDQSLPDKVGQNSYCNIKSYRI